MPRVAPIDDLHPLPPALASERLVEGDSRQPGRKGRTAGELIQVLVRAEVRILYDVFSFVIVPNNAAGHPKNTLVVAPHQDFERGHIASQNEANDFCVGQGLRTGFFTGRVQVTPRILPWATKSLLYA